jgi:hypothetical protein
MALRASDRYFSFSPGNSDFLFASGTFVYMMRFPIFHIPLKGGPFSPDTGCHLQVFLIFGISFGDTFGKHAEITIDQKQQN